MSIQYPSVYVPGLVPQSGDVQAVELFLSEELERIAVAIRLNSVQPAYGLVRIATPKVGPAANIAPQRMNDWDSVGPAVPNRIIATVADGRLQVEESGTYYAFFDVSVSINSGRDYIMQIYIDGAPSGINVEVDSSNQTASIIISGSGMAQMKAGQYIELWYSSTQNGSTWNVRTANFGLFRISEIQRVLTANI